MRWNYSEVLAKFDPGRTVTGQSIFSTLPGNGVYDVSITNAFMDQVVRAHVLLTARAA